MPIENPDTFRVSGRRDSVVEAEYLQDEQDETLEVAVGLKQVKFHLTWAQIHFDNSERFPNLFVTMLSSPESWKETRTRQKHLELPELDPGVFALVCRYLDGEKILPLDQRHVPIGAIPMDTLEELKKQADFLQLRKLAAEVEKAIDHPVQRARRGTTQTVSWSDLDRFKKFFAGGRKDVTLSVILENNPNLIFHLEGCYLLTMIAKKSGSVSPQDMYIRLRADFPRPAKEEYALELGGTNSSYVVDGDRSTKERLTGNTLCSMFGSRSSINSPSVLLAPHIFGTHSGYNIGYRNERAYLWATSLFLRYRLTDMSGELLFTIEKADFETVWYKTQQEHQAHNVVGLTHLQINVPSVKKLERQRKRAADKEKEKRRRSESGSDSSSSDSD